LRIFSSTQSGAILDFILINTSAALVVLGMAKDFKHGVEIAREAISSGLALKTLQTYIQASNL
jgi:anthranilate phosphoribosyltransferase